MDMSPFDLRGPQFLAFYLALIALVTLVLWLVRRVARNAGGTSVLGSRTTLDPYETAFLAGGGERAMMVALAALAERGCVQFREADSLRLRNDGRASHVVERVLMGRLKENLSIREVRRELRPAFETIKRTLQQQGLLFSDPARALLNFLTLLLVGGVLLVGIAKMIIGHSRDKEISLLIVFSALYVIAAIIGYTRFKPFRSAAGDAMLYRLRSAHPKTAKRAAGPTDTADMGLPSTLVALWGMDALIGYDYHDELERTLAHTNGTGRDSGSSSCSGSSCSSSSSDSGGGDGGGGGCGGCGGCGD
jgi:uncharacterized protein (TIGR04222 family)